MAELGLSINGVHCTDLGLHLKSYTIGTPNVKTNIIKIPYTDRSIDLTDMVDGLPHYDNRTIKFTLGKVCNSMQEWSDLVTTIVSTYHGQKVDVIFDSDIAYFYTGRISFDVDKARRTIGEITATMIAEPYKYSVNDYGEDYLWNPFNFETDYAITYKDVVVNGSRIFEFRNFNYYPMNVKFEVKKIDERTGVSIFIKSRSLAQSEVRRMISNEGVYRFPDVIVQEGYPFIIIEGQGIVTIYGKRGAI